MVRVTFIAKLTPSPINAPNALPAKYPAIVDTEPIIVNPTIVLTSLLNHSKYDLVLVAEAETFNPIATLAVTSQFFPVLPQYGHLPV